MSSNQDHRISHPAAALSVTQRNDAFICSALWVRVRALVCTLSSHYQPKRNEQINKDILLLRASTRPTSNRMQIHTWPLGSAEHHTCVLNSLINHANAYLEVLSVDNRWRIREIKSSAKKWAVFSFRLSFFFPFRKQERNLKKKTHLHVDRWAETAAGGGGTGSSPDHFHFCISSQACASCMQMEACLSLQNFWACSAFYVVKVTLNSPNVEFSRCR